VALPHHELGRKAVEVLFAEIDHDPGNADRMGTVHLVPMPMRERASVAPPASDPALTMSATAR